MRDLTSKRTVIILGLMASIIAMIASGRNWVLGSVNDGVVSDYAVKVTGNEAVPGFFGIAIAAAAGIMAAATTGRIMRIIAAAVSMIASVALVAVLIKTLADPADPVRGRMSNVTGHTGSALIRGHVQGWFWVAVFASMVSLAASVLCVIGLRRWAGLSSRYDAPSEVKKERTTSDWDLMNEGVDPTVETGNETTASISHSEG